MELFLKLLEPNIKYQLINRCILTNWYILRIKNKHSCEIELKYGKMHLAMVVNFTKLKTP